MSSTDITSPTNSRASELGFWRSFRTATWLGWQIESNWTDPFLFAIYSFIKPISTAAILVVMYGIITQGNFESPIFTYMYLGNAFYIYVGAVMAGVSWAVIDDREHYKTLKYMYVAPIHIPMYLFGRGVAKFIVGSISVLITIVFGMLFLHLRIDLATVNWPLFTLALVIGVAGAIFPLEVLPTAIRWIGYIIPITYWLELIRRALVGEVADAFPTLASLSNEQILGILIGLTIVFGVLSFFVFRWAENQARERGLIDMVTNY
jgi:ABC-2 type transport system permease protein